MQLPYSEELNIEYLGQLFANTSECYKFFWFKAIVEKVAKGKTELTYEELVDDMIANAWYMVTEYHLNLGPKDTLESLVALIKQKNPELKSSEKKDVIFNFLKNTDDKEIISKKRILTYNVPYRLQSPFMKNVKGKEWNAGENELIEKINREKRLMYYFTALNASSKSSIISSIFSVPIESLIVFGLIPWSRSSASLSCECVVLAGWITRDFTSATLARSEKSSRLSMKSLAF